MRTYAAKGLVKIGGPSVGPLIAALRDTEKDVRRRAAEALGSIGDPRAVEPLCAALKDGDEDVCKKAAEALGQIGDARAAERLCAALREAKKTVRKVAGVALLGLYRSGNLSDGQKRVILAQREKITEKHTDGWMIVSGHSESTGQPSDCTHVNNEVREHRDTGVGVDFPL